MGTSGFGGRNGKGARDWGPTSGVMKLISISRDCVDCTLTALPPSLRPNLVRPPPSSAQSAWVNGLDGVGVGDESLAVRRALWID